MVLFILFNVKVVLMQNFNYICMQHMCVCLCAFSLYRLFIRICQIFNYIFSTLQWAPFHFLSWVIAFYLRLVERKRIRSDGMPYIYDISLLYYQFVKAHMCVYSIYLLVQKLQQKKKKQKSRKVDKKNSFLFCLCFFLLLVFLTNSFCRGKRKKNDTCLRLFAFVIHFLALFLLSLTTYFFLSLLLNVMFCDESKCDDNRGLLYLSHIIRLKIIKKN